MRYQRNLGLYEPKPFEAISDQDWQAIIQKGVLQLFSPPLSVEGDGFRSHFFACFGHRSYINQCSLRMKHSFTSHLRLSIGARSVDNWEIYDKQTYFELCVSAVK